MSDIAAFDFDGTLTTGGSVFAFLTAVRGRRTVLAATTALSWRLAHAAVAGGEVADRTKEMLFVRVLAGVSSEQLASTSTDFAEHHLASKVRDDVHRRFEWHRQRGDRIAIVSASPECYVRAIGARLGADEVIATRLETTPDGHLTGHYDGHNCRGEEKLRRLQAWIAESDRSNQVAESDGSGLLAASDGSNQVDKKDPPPRLWAYGNSRGDLRMLSAADIGIDVGRLGSIGRLRAFSRLGDLRSAEMTP